MKKVVSGVIAFLALAALIGFLATGKPGSAPRTSGETSGAGIGSRAPSRAAEPAPAHFSSNGYSAVKGVQGTSPATALSTSVPQIGPDIVKTGDLTVRVKKGGFQEAFQSATLIAARYGGFVESSSAVNDRSGWLQIRVPASSFESAVADLRGLGKVKGQSVSGQDVTSQFVDLGARLATWKSQEAALLRLMSRATTIGDTLRIQNELQAVQVRIEQIQGELRVLRNQTSLATIRVALQEPGAPVTPVKPSQTPSLARAWHRAVAGFLGVLSSVVVGLGYLVPIALLFGGGWLIYRRMAHPGAVEAQG